MSVFAQLNIAKPFSDLKVLGLQADDSACGNYRVRFPLQALEQGGAHVRIHQGGLGLNELQEFDMILAQRQFHPSIRDLLQTAQYMQKTVIYEIDDNVHEVHRNSPVYQDFRPGSPAYEGVRDTMQMSDGLFTTSAELASQYSQWAKRTWVLPNAIDFGFRDWDTPVERHPDLVGKVVIGWAGSICFDDKTEVLTDTGFKLFKDLKGGELVATISEAGALEYQAPSEHVVYDYNGPMMVVEQKHVDFCVTPSHWLYAAKRSVGDKKSDLDYHRIQAKDLFGKRFYCKKNASWDAPDVPMFTVPGGPTFRMEDWLQFFGFWLAEGWASASRRKEGGKDYDLHHVGICQYKSLVEIAALSGMMKSYGYNCHLRKDGAELVIVDAALWRYLRQFGKAHEKHVPGDILATSSRQLHLLLEWYLKGDGAAETGPRCDKERLRAHTVSRRLADNLTEIALKIGWAANVRNGGMVNGNIAGKTIYARHDRYIVAFLRNDGRYNYLTPCVLPKAQREEHYTGKVYCVIVPNHTLYVRRNGICHWSGNTHQDDHRVLAGVLRPVLEKYPQAVFAMVSAYQTMDIFEAALDIPKDRLVRLDPVAFASYPELPAQFDIGLVPVVSTPFNMAKSDLKIIEYGARRVPYVASQIAPYTRFHIDTGGQGGYLCNSRQEWVDAISRLVEDELTRKLCAEFMETHVREERSMQGNAYRWAEAMREAVTMARHTPELERKYTVPVKPGRNDLCPCGSGTKYKKCHSPTWG